MAQTTEDGVRHNAPLLTFAVFGLGRAGSIHLRNLVCNPSAVVKYVVEANQERAQQVAKECGLRLGDRGKILRAEEAETVYEDKSVDAVVVTTFTDAHKEIVQKALEAGKSVFCEKPIATNISDADSCYELAEKKNRFLFCAFNRRFDPSIEKLQRQVRSGLIGQVQSIKACSRDCPKPFLDYLKISGGIFHDCIIHDIDILCWIVGEYPDVVYAQGHAFQPESLGSGDVDQVAVTMKFPSGVLGMVDASRDCCFGYDQRLEVFGSKGMLQTTNSSATNIISYLGPNGQTADPIPFSFPQRYADAYALEMDYFIRHELGVDNSVKVTRRETIMASTLAEACEQSYRKGTPVRMKELYSVCENKFPDSKSAKSVHDKL